MENEEQEVTIEESGVAKTPEVMMQTQQQTSSPVAEVNSGLDWKVALAGALGVLAVLAILLAVFASAGIRSAQDTISDIERANNQSELEGGWRLYDGEHFSAEFPGEVLTASDSFSGETETINLETYQAASRFGSAYTITMLDLTTDEQDLEAAIQSAVAAGATTGGGVLVEDRYEPVTNGIATAYYKVSYSGENATQEAYLFATTERFYQVIVLYENETEPQGDVQRFLDSFEQK